MSHTDFAAIARRELEENRYRTRLYEDSLKEVNGSEEDAKRIYVEKRVYEMSNEGHLSGEKELKPMLMPLIVIYTIGIILTGWLVYSFVK
jgi:hypothetical protein